MSNIQIDANNRITIKGAREHNLKNVNLVLPRNKLIVMTGLSGSGKSSLAFDTIFADGQRRYMESLSSYSSAESATSWPSSSTCARSGSMATRPRRSTVRSGCARRMAAWMRATSSRGRKGLAT